MNATTGQDIWYLARNGRQHGPLSDAEMTKLVELGHLRATDLVWKPGFTDWRPAPSVFPTTTASVEPPAPAPAAQAPTAQQPYVPQSYVPQGQAPIAQTPMSMQAAAAPAENAAPGPVRIDTRLFMPAGQTSRPEPSEKTRGPAGPVPEDEPTRSSNRSVIVPLIVLALISGLSAAGYHYRSTIETTLLAVRHGPPAAPPPTIKAPPEASKTIPAAAPAAEAPAPASAPAAEAPVPAPAPSVDAAAIDAGLQKSPMWALLKSEFPDWYAERLREVGQMTDQQKPDSEINAKLIEAVVALRRQNADKALAASPARLQEIATAFIANLSALQSQSVDACYGFISKGETTPLAVSLVQKPVEGAPLHAQLQAVFAAVAEGRKSPAQRAQPQKSDYDLLAAELGAIGWSQADIQLFADPKALSEAPRERVCKMVRDWFSAHLAVKDEGAKERLLFETLRPVVAG